jgi:hypothetical protein
MGILNGIDSNVFDPRTDYMLEANYGIRDSKTGKEKNKEFILHHFNLNVDLKYYLTEGVSQVYLLAGYSNYWINTQPGDAGLLQTRPGGNFGAGAYIKATEQFGFITEFKMQSQNTRWPVLRVGAVLNLN